MLEFHNKRLDQLTAEKISALETEDLLLARAKSADKEAYLAALKRVKRSAPLPDDEIK